MSNPLRTLEDYELFLYTLPEQFQSVRRCTVVLTRCGASLARVAGEIQFELGFRLVVVERIVANRMPAVLDAYGYEIWREHEKLCWYDCQPHPDEPALQATHPHYKHVLPDLKRPQAASRPGAEPELPQSQSPGADRGSGAIAGAAASVRRAVGASGPWQSRRTEFSQGPGDEAEQGQGEPGARGRGAGTEAEGVIVSGLCL